MQLVPVMNISVIGQTQFLTSQNQVKSALIDYNIKSNSSKSYDNISNKLTKCTKGALIKPLTLLMNQMV